MSHKTQCPRCHTIYPMPAAKIGDEKARANCGKCQHTFFLNAHIIKDEPEGLIQDGTDKDDHTAPKVAVRPKKTKAKPVKEGMIFDEMATDKEDVEDVALDGLDDFINQQIQKQTVQASTTINNINQHDDEAWLDELIKSDASSNIKTAPTARTNDDLSDILGADLGTLIPEINTQENSDNIRKKINERIKTNAPSQEQLMTHRSLGSYVFWGLGCLLMLALLAGQYILFNSDSLAKTDKASMINGLCQNCLPSADIGVIKSGYVLRKGEADFSTDVIGVLKNTSTTDQLYPNIKVKIMGANGLIGDLALAPKDYLATPTRFISASSDGRFMLTVGVAPEDIVSVSIEPFY